MIERTEGPPERKVPALVVSGFLGSGKTTLIRHLLADALRRNVRVALVSNELGELGIDRALLGGGGDAYVELAGGCVCCALSDDLVRTLQELYERYRPDVIVVETSGAALPWDTQLNFWREPVRRWIGDDTALVVVNAEQVAEGRDLEGTFADQLSSADLIVLNKVDLVAPAARDAVHARLREIEPEAPIVTAVQGVVDATLLFPPDPPDPPTPPDAGRIDRSAAPPAPVPHTHEQFATEIWTPPPGLDERALAARVTAGEVLRAKGFVLTDLGPRLLQSVGRRCELHELDTPPPPELLGRVVLIRRVRAGAG